MDFKETSHVAIGSRVDGLGHTVASLANTTNSLIGENKNLTLLVCALVVIIIILLIIMYKVYTYTSRVEDLVYGRSKRFIRRKRNRPRYETTDESDYEDYEDW